MIEMHNIYPCLLVQVGAEKPGVPAISNEEQFDNLNKSQATATPSTNSSKPIRNLNSVNLSVSESSL